MSTCIYLRVLLIAVLSVLACCSAPSSFATTPIMGYNSYNDVACSPNETQIAAAINAMADRGFLLAGYKHFQIDCGWASRSGVRNATTGALTWDADRFPSGIQPLSDLARSKGFTWSMYSNAGVRMCDTQSPSPVLGSLGHEQADAEQFKAWGVEYLKYDNCYADGPTAQDNAPKDPRTDFPSRYGAMWNALEAVGIPNMLICQWGTPYASSMGLEGPVAWTEGISTSFRLSDDVADSYPNVYRIMNEAIYVSKTGLTGPGHFGDADLLEVGNNGMSLNEQATQFTAWAMLKSALMVSTNIPGMSDQALKILQNEDLIAINQDSLGKPVTLVQRWSYDRDLYSGPLANGDMAVLLVNQRNTSRSLTIDFTSLGIKSADAQNLWTSTSSTGISKYTVITGGHGSIPLRLSNIEKLAAPPPVTYVNASTGVLSNGAAVTTWLDGTAVTGIGGNETVGGSLTVTGIKVPAAGTATLLFDYINCQVGYLGNGTNDRNASITVNGGNEMLVSFPLSGYDWSKDVMKDYRVELDGFEAGTMNNITVSGDGLGFGPELVRIGVPS